LRIRDLRFVICNFALMVTLVASGCTAEKHPRAQLGVNDYRVGDYRRAREVLRPLAAKTDEDYVLNNVRLGSAALSDYDLREAESAFYRAYEVINSVGVNDAGRASAAIFLDEKLKIWKGEPFERAMANFYLGVIYYMQQDYANARAAFENALFKLRDYGEGDVKGGEYQEVESNFAIAQIMLGKCWLRLGYEDKAAAMFERVARSRHDLRSLVDWERMLKSNVLLIVEQGQGPQKILHGDNSVVGFWPHPHEVGPVPRPVVRVNGQVVNISGVGSPPVDLLELAQDRRWQSIDTIRLFKSILGSGLMVAGAYQANRRDQDLGSAAVLLISGALLKATATGDVRHWEMLPRSVFIVPLYLPPGKHNVSVTFGGSGQSWRGIVAPQSGEAAYYFRATRYGEVKDWPPENWADARRLSADAAIHNRDRPHPDPLPGGEGIRASGGQLDR
jgi:tetratricopeptide (TPR) repeat protein